MACLYYYSKEIIIFITYLPIHLFVRVCIEEVEENHRRIDSSKYLIININRHYFRSMYDIQYLAVLKSHKSVNLYKFVNILLE